MKTYQEIYQHLIYEWNEKSISEELQNLQKERQLHHNSKIINERAYCDNFSQEFENYFVNIFKQIWNNILQDPTNNIIEIPFNLIINKLSKENFKNYKDFDLFLNTLKQNIGIIELSIINNGCYYECPTDIFKKEIKIYSDYNKISELNLKKFNEANLAKVRNFYEQYLNKITENSNTLNIALSKIKTNLINNYEWGRINIDFKYFNNKQFINDLDVVISHEFQHLMDYLININYENWNYCRKYSNTAHNSFNRQIHDLSDNDKNFEKINYFLDSGEFSQLKSTYIQYLRKCFVKNTNNLSQENLNDFLAAFYQICKFNFKNFNYKNNNVKFYQDKITKLRDIQDIITFFKITYDDSIYAKHQLNTINKWDELNTTLQTELKNQLI